MTRRLMLIAGGLSGALLLIVALWSSVGHHDGSVPVVQADQRPVRVKPLNPGGMQIAGLSADPGQASDAAAADKLAPAPETPDPQGLARQTPAVAPTPGAPASGAVKSGAPTSSAPTSSVPTYNAWTPPDRARAQSVLTAAAPAQQPAAASSTAVKPVSVVPAAAVPDHHPAAPAAHPPLGRTHVQLAALPTEAAAHQEWDRLTHRMPSVLGSYHPVFSKIEHDGHTLWRVRTGDFTSEAEASQFCQQVRANGGGCAVAAF
jgi:hypothetical protein